MLKILAVCFVLSLISFGARAQSGNLLPNASFTEMEKGKLAQWNAKSVEGDIKFDVPDAGHVGGKSLMISSEQGGRGTWSCDIEGKPFAQYRLTGWVKTENVEPADGDGVVITLSSPSGTVSNPIKGTADWRELGKLEAVTRVDDTLRLTLSLGEKVKATGKVWFNDLRLELVSSELPEANIAIDAAKQAAPISPYVYGQFIEHLGHCIYGGIWAEMLQDRKFFHKAGTKESPWRVYLGNQPPDTKKVIVGGTVKMSEEKPFVGAQTPVVVMSGKVTPIGIMQGDLSFRAGKDYVGYAWLAGDPEGGPVEITFYWGNGINDVKTVLVTDVTPEYKKVEFKFTPGADTDMGRILIAGRGKGTFRIGTVSLMPADNVNGMRPDTLALLKELNAPVYRWPGGNFVSGYNWRDGIGERDKRPPRKNPAWKGVEHNDFGIDEFLLLCRAINADPYIAVNTGLGSAQDAIEELQYANGAPDSAFGKLRAQNGHPEPYGVKWWGIGNEMYGDWQLGHMPLAEYVKKHNAYVDAMRAADPSIKVVAVGATGEWSKTMLGECADRMDMLSEHIYVQDKKGPLSHSRLLADGLRDKVAAHRTYLKEIPALQKKFVPIALDEWNYWYGPDLYGEIGTRYFLKDGIGVAAGLNEIFRNSDIFQMANYAQTVNVIGAIKTSPTAAAFDTTGLVLKMYRAHFGAKPLTITGEFGVLDVVAALTEDGKALTLSVVNATRNATDLKFSISGLVLSGTGQRWTVAGSDPMLYNEPGKPPAVRIEETPLANAGNTLNVPALSACIYRLDVK